MMWNSHDSVGFAVLTGLCFQMGFSFEGAPSRPVTTGPYTTGGPPPDVSSEHHPHSSTYSEHHPHSTTLTAAPGGENPDHHPHCSTTGGEYPDVSSEHHPYSPTGGEYADVSSEHHPSSTTGGEYPDVFSQHQPHSSSSTTSQHHKGRVP
ncbi:unnamed protein product [Boreogadus saida]